MLFGFFRLGQIHWGSPCRLSARVDLYELCQIALVCRIIFRPPVAVIEHLGNDVGERHISSFQYEQRLIHLGIDPDRTSLASTRHSYHFVVTVYKSNLNMATFIHMVYNTAVNGILPSNFRSPILIIRIPGGSSRITYRQGINPAGCKHQIPSWLEVVT